MPYTTPATVVAGTTGASAWGNSVKAALDWLANPPTVRAVRSSNQSISSGAMTAVQFNTADIHDTAAIHDTVTSNTRLTVPAGAGGVWAMWGTVRFASNATGTRALQILFNGATLLVEDERAASAAGAVTINLYTEYKMVPGDYIELRANQTSGGALNLEGSGATVYPAFGMTWRGLG